MLATDEGEAIRAAVSVARDTLLRVARADQLSADVSTGRGVATSHEGVAASLGVCKKTVQRARKLLESFGLAVTIVEGRYLSAAERAAARQLHGGRQIKAASVRALTLPKHLAGRNVHLPRRGKVLHQSPLRNNSPTRVPARTAPASQSRSKMSKGRYEGRGRPRSVAMQRFAARLVDGVHGDVMERRMPWLLKARNGGRVHIGALCDVLMRAGVDPARWTPRELVETVDRWHQDHGRATLAGGSSDPLRYFAWQLRQAIDPNALTHSERVKIRRAQLEAERNARAIEVEQERARMAAVDRDEVARIIAQMKADIAATSASRSRQKRQL